VALLRRFGSIEGARVVLPAATYALTAANGGPLVFAVGVTLVGKIGVVLTGDRVRMEVLAAGHAGGDLGDDGGVSACMAAA